MTWKWNKPIPAAQVKPWYPNESQTLEQAAIEVSRARTSIEETINDIAHSLNDAWWKGNDAEAFRNRWLQERAALQNLREQLFQTEMRIRDQAISESSRFRIQELGG
jgi:uncharacterized protein YukE